MSQGFADDGQEPLDLIGISPLCGGGATMQPHGEHLVIVIGLGHLPHLADFLNHQFFSLHGPDPLNAIKGLLSCIQDMIFIYYCQYIYLVLYLYICYA